MTMQPSTHQDWNPQNVDLLTCCEIPHRCYMARRLAITIESLWESIEFDSSFPPYRRDLMDRRVWRLPDLNEYFDGAR
jgi:hypothetical protein